MIVTDTSALIEIALNEQQAARCSLRLADEETILLSAGALAEAFIVAWRRAVIDEVELVIQGLGCEVIEVTAESARRVSLSYQKWGKGIHPAALNFGDCFSYDLAKSRGCPLLFVGNEFTRTDIVPALKGT